MAEGYWFAPETEETSFLGQLSVNTPVITEVRMDSTHKEHFRNMVGNRMMQ